MIEDVEDGRSTRHETVADSALALPDFRAHLARREGAAVDVAVDVGHDVGEFCGRRVTEPVPDKVEGTLAGGDGAVFSRDDVSRWGQDFSVKVYTGRG